MTDVMSQYVNRVRLWLAGISFGGRRDLYQLFGYHRNPLHLDYVARYLRQDIAKRVIDAPVLATWCDAPEISDGAAGATDDTPFETAWNAIAGQGASISQNGPTANLWQSIIRLDKLAGLGSYAGMILGFDDGQKLDQPVKKPNGDGARKITYLQPYAEACISVATYEQNQASPRFGRPVTYTISPGRFTAETRTGMISGVFTSEQGRAPFPVHYTRFLHVAENLLEDNVYGRSRMEVVVNVLDDILKVAGGSAEIFWMIANRGMQVDVDKDMDMDDTAAADLAKEVEEYQHEIRRFIRTRGVKINQLGADSVDPSGVFNVLLSLMSAATGIPKLVLIGSSTGALSSQQDRGNWSDRISERVTEYAEPVILLQLIALLINAGVLPMPDLTNFAISWPEAFKMNPLERAQTSAQMARSAANLTKTVSLLQGTAATTDPNTGETIPGKPAQEPLFTRQEMRQIVGFGKRMPVFEEDSTGAPPVDPSETDTGATDDTTED